MKYSGQAKAEAGGKRVACAWVNRLTRLPQRGVGRESKDAVSSESIIHKLLLLTF
jgi:hypothetical protein